MGEENINVEEMATETTVADIVQEETQIVETEDSSNQSSGCGKAIAIGVAAAGIAAGAGYGLYRLGKVVVGKVKREMLKKQAQKEIDEFDDDDGDEPIPELVEETAETTEVVEQKVEFPDHKKKHK